MSSEPLSTEHLPGFQCLAQAFATLYGIDVKEIYRFLGHDGSERVFITDNDQSSRRAFHWQEMLDFSYKKYNKLVTMVERTPVSTNGEDIYTVKGFTESRFFQYVQRFDGVLIGIRRSNGACHAVAWKNQMVIDDNACMSIAMFNNLFNVYLFLLPYQIVEK